MRFDPTWNDPDRFAGIRHDYGPIDVEGLAGSFQICCGRVSTRLPFHQSWCWSQQCGTKIALATAWVLGRPILPIG
jgi:hypothetical protein